MSGEMGMLPTAAGVIVTPTGPGAAARPDAVVWAGRRLHLGCGDHHLPAPWVNADGAAAPAIRGRACQAPDVLLDVRRDLAVIPAGTLDWVYWSHGPEHIHRDQLPDVLAQIQRILVLGGRVTIATIDLTGIFRAYERGATAADWNSYLYGDARSTDDPFMAHRQCFDYASLATWLAGAGLTPRPWDPTQYPEIAALNDCSSMARVVSCFAEGVK